MLLWRSLVFIVVCIVFLQHEIHVEGRLLHQLSSLRGGKATKKLKSIFQLTTSRWKREKAEKQHKKSNGSVSPKKAGKRVLVSTMSEEEKAKIANRQRIFQSVEEGLLSLSNMVLSRVITKLNWKDSVVVNQARIVFVGYLIFAQVFHLLLNFLIQRSGNNDTVNVPANPLVSALGPLTGGNPMLQMLGGVMAAKSKDEPLTATQYDLARNKELLSTVFSEIVMVAILHFVFRMKAPLLMVPLWGVTSRLKSPLMYIHLLRFRPFGSLARPFRPQWELMLQNMMQSGLSTSVEITEDPPAVSVSDATATEAATSNEEEEQEGTQEEHPEKQEKEQYIEKQQQEEQITEDGDPNDVGDVELLDEIVEIDEEQTDTATEDSSEASQQPEQWSSMLDEELRDLADSMRRRS